MITKRSRPAGRKAGVRGRPGGKRFHWVGLVAIKGTVRPDPLPPAPRGTRWVGLITETSTIAPIGFEFGRPRLEGHVRHSARVEFYLESIRRPRRTRRISR